MRKDKANVTTFINKFCLIKYSLLLINDLILYNCQNSI